MSRYYNAVLLLLCVLATSQLVSSCGVTTHNVIAHRAISAFKSSEFSQYSDIIASYPEAFQNGVAFPDWGYDCIWGKLYSELPSASEFAHWPPFQRAIVDYIRQTFGSSYISDAEARRVIAFLLGVSSHSSADILWHSLRNVGVTGQGFIQALANSDYNFQGNRYDGSIHSQADVGGEFMCAYEVNLSFLKSKWYLPTKHLVQIYHSLNYTRITADILETCNAELYCEVQAIKRLPSQMLYPYFASKSPFLVDEFQDWFIGGIDDMAVFSKWCWPELIRWIENGTTDNDTRDGFPSYCPSHITWNQLQASINNHESQEPINHNNTNDHNHIPNNNNNNNNDNNIPVISNSPAYLKVKDHRLEWRKALKEQLKPYSQRIQVNIEKTGDGSIFSAVESDTSVTLSTSPSIPQPNQFQHINIPPQIQQQRDDNNNNNDNDNDNDNDNNIVMRSKRDSNNNNNNYKKEMSLDAAYCNARREPDMMFVTDRAYSLLGSSVATADFDQDKYDDIVLGAPGMSDNNYMRRGAVYIIFGTRTKNYNHTSLASIDIDTEVQGHRTIILWGEEESNARFGYAVTTLDFNADGYDDLIVSAPGHDSNTLGYKGKVFVYFGGKQGHISRKPNITIVSQKRYTSLGSSLSVGDIDGDGKNDLIVGSPMYTYSQNMSDKFESGQVTIYLSSQQRSNGQVLDHELDSDWTINSTDFWSWFGFQSQVVSLNGDRFLIVSSPMYNSDKGSVGRLSAYNITSRSLQWTVTGTDKNTRFGYSFAVTQNKNDKGLLFAVGMPSKDIPGYWFWEQTKYQAGRVIVFRVDNLSGDYSIKDLKIETTLNADERFAKLGWQVQWTDFNGDGVSELFASEPYRDTPQGGADAGMSFLWSGSSLPKGDNTGCQKTAQTCFVSKMTKSLYGKQMLPLDFNGDGKKDLLLTGPRAIGHTSANINCGGAMIFYSV